MTFARQQYYAFQDGKQRKAIEAAENMLKENIAPEVVARCVGLSLEQVLQLQQEITVTP